jgi:hypothetical protein
MERFTYHALAVGLAGKFEEPFAEVLPVQASVALPEGGGFGTSRVGYFRFRDIISVGSVTAVVAGSHDEWKHTYDALATVTIERLDVLGMVKADYIVARIAASHPEDGSPPSIIPLGSHFENLWIAGRRVELDLATDTFTRLDTAEKVRQAYRGDEGGFRKEFDALSSAGKGDQIPARLRSYFPWRDQQAGEAIPERQGEIQCSLVRQVNGLESCVVSHGHTIHVQGFGVIRLAEFRIAESSRRLTMLQIDLGSTPSGSVSGGGVEGNGSGW